MSKTKKRFALGNLNCGHKDSKGKVRVYTPGEQVACTESEGQRLEAEGAVTTDEKEAARLRRSHEEASEIAEADAIAEEEAESEDESESDVETPSLSDAGETQPGDEQLAKKPRGKKAAPVAAAPAAKKKPGKRGK